MTKAFVIDPQARTVKAIEFDGYWEAKKIIGSRAMDIVMFDNDHLLYVDDEGMLASANYFYRIPTYPKPLAGKSILVGFDRQTMDECDATIQLDDLKSKVTFVDTKVREVVDSEGIFHGVTIMKREVIFEPETVLPHAE